MSPELEAAAHLFGLLSHPMRLRIVVLLSETSPLAAGTLQELLGVERTALSHQLRLLREARLVRVEQRGRRRLYRLADHHVAHIVGDTLAHVAEDHGCT